MKAPELYSVRKLPLRLLKDYDCFLKDFDDTAYYVSQNDNLLFRQLRIISGHCSKRNKDIIFVDCKGATSENEAIEKIVIEGFWINGTHYVISERSASMTRQNILSFVNEAYNKQLEETVTLGVYLDHTVLSKYYAYRGLMLSSCHCLENWLPKIIVVKDYFRIIPNQHIKYIHDSTSTFIGKNGIEQKWTQKDISDTVRDIKINAFDGCGIHHPEITKQVQNLLGIQETPTSILWRAPFIKGVTSEIDYTAFFKENNVKSIEDVWGIKHNINEPMIIITESMYKGIKYFYNSGTAEDWDNYWKRFKKYNHCLGIAKWNYPLDREPVKTRTSYQILQDLKLDYKAFSLIAKDSVRWLDKLSMNSPLYSLCFLGLTYDKHQPRNDYDRAILKNPEILKEYEVRRYIISSAKKYANDMKCGKLWVDGAFKFLVPDLIMLMQHIGKLPVTGCLEADEFYGHDINGTILGERVIERNPHICHSEHTILKGVSNKYTKKYFKHLDNICMINCKSIVPQKINGADFDGDLVFVINNDIIKSGVDRNACTVMDIDDKITVSDEANTLENRLKLILRTTKSLIGEFSNYASAYHNKMPMSKEQKDKYDKYIDIISVLTGKSIDYAKTGVLYCMPKHIAKYGHPLPYFMKYVSDYYNRQKLNKSNSNMNKLCRELEKWHNEIRWQKNDKNFDYTIMIDNNLKYTEEQYKAIENIYLRFVSESAKLMEAFKKGKTLSEDLNNYLITDNLGKQYVNWDLYYSNIRKKCLSVVADIQLVANIAVKLCYEVYTSRSKKFMWAIAGPGIVNNIKQTEVYLPQKTENGKYDYLGHKYNMKKIEEEILFD